MRDLLISILCGFAILFIMKWGVDKKFPDADKLKHENGYIIHPTYGKYPEDVKYTQGMTLYPGQTTWVGMNINMRTETDKED